MQLKDFVEALGMIVEIFQHHLFVFVGARDAGNSCCIVDHVFGDRGFALRSRPQHSGQKRAAQTGCCEYLHEFTSLKHAETSPKKASGRTLAQDTKSFGTRAPENRGDSPVMHEMMYSLRRVQKFWRHDAT